MDTVTAIDRKSFAVRCLVVVFAYLRRAAMPFLAGTVLACAFAPFGFWWAAWIAPAFWYVSICYNRETGIRSTWRGDFFYGWHYGLAVYLVGGFWVIELNALPWIVLAVVEAVPFAIFGIIAGWLLRMVKPHLRPIAFAALWTLFEASRTVGKYAFPWFFLSSAQVRVLPMLQIVELTAQWGLTFVIAFAASLLGAAWQARQNTPRRALAMTIAALFLPLALYLFGTVRMRAIADTLKNLPTRTVAVVQGNPERDTVPPEGFLRHSLDIYTDLTRKASRELDQQKQLPIFVAWPEEAMVGLQNSPLTFPNVAALSQTKKIPVLSGSYENDDRGVWNAAVLVNGYRVTGRYNKQRLVPIGEFFPMRPLLGWIYGQYRVPKNDYSEGIEQGIFSVGDSNKNTATKIGMLICYEDVFPYLSRHRSLDGAEALVVLTSDDTFGTTAGPEQHWEQAAIRAVETRRGLVRAAESGESQIILPTGEVAQKLPLGKRGYLIGKIVLNNEITVSTYWGEWVLWLCGVIVIGSLIGSRLDTRRSPLAQPENSIDKDAVDNC